MAAYRQLLGDVVLTLPGVKESKSYVVMEEVKESYLCRTMPEVAEALAARVEAQHHDADVKRVLAVMQGTMPGTGDEAERLKLEAQKDLKAKAQKRLKTLVPVANGFDFEDMD